MMKKIQVKKVLVVAAILLGGMVAAAPHNAGATAKTGQQHDEQVTAPGGNAPTAANTLGCIV